jgi:hypothetical protein
MSECKIAADLKDASYYCMILVVILMFDLIGIMLSSCLFLSELCLSYVLRLAERKSNQIQFISLNAMKFVFSSCKSQVLDCKLVFGRLL